MALDSDRIVSWSPQLQAMPCSSRATVFLSAGKEQAPGAQVHFEDQMTAGLHRAFQKP